MLWSHACNWASRATCALASLDTLEKMLGRNPERTGELQNVE
jgi:hypothetical protein